MLPSKAAGRTVSASPGDMWTVVSSLLHRCTEWLLTVKAHLVSQTPLPPEKEHPITQQLSNNYRV